MGHDRPRIGIIGPGTSHYIFRDIVRGAAARAVDEECQLLVYAAGRYLRGTRLRSTRHSEREMATRFADPGLVDAVILYASGLMPNLKLTDVVEFADLLPGRVVTVGIELNGRPSVTIDNAEGMRLIVKHLIDAHAPGRLAFVSGPSDHPESAMRMAGARAAAEEAGLQIPDAMVVEGNFQPTTGVDAVRVLLDERVRRPDAIVCANDAMAQAVIHELGRRGVRVPGDIIVSGFDDSSYAVIGDPSITTARQGFSVQGAEAVSLALRYVHEGSVESLSLSPTPVIRRSCGCQARLIDQYPDVVLTGQPEFTTLVTLLVTALKRHETELLRDQIESVLVNVPERGDHMLSLALQEARRQLAGIVSEEELEAASAAAAVSAAQYDASVQRRRRLVEDELATNELLLSRTLDEIVDPQQLLLDVQDVFRFIGVREYEFIRITDENTGSVIAGPGPSTGDSETVELGELCERIRKVAGQSGPATVTAVAPLPFLADLMGYGVLNVDPHAVQSVDTVAFAFGAMFNRFRVMEELDRLEALRKESYQRQLATQQQLIESERLASLGRLVAGVAHELNTPLGVTTTALTHLYTQTARIAGALRSDVPDAHKWIADAREAISIVERSVGRMADIVTKFQAIAPERGGEAPMIDSREVAQAVVTSMAAELKAVSVTAEVSVPIPIRVRIPIDVFSRILYAMLSNSVEHAFVGRDGGHITLAVVPDADGARIDCCDDGIGVGAEVLEQLFDPFFTTRRAKGHLGLGLHAVYNLVTSTIGGTIRAECPEGSGLMIRIWIPGSMVMVDERA